jgi:DNA repair protein RecO (recombination protein O)
VAEPLKLTGVVLRTVDYGEADRVVTLLTAERGKVSAFARAARASRRRCARRATATRSVRAWPMAP